MPFLASDGAVGGWDGAVDVQSETLGISLQAFFPFLPFFPLQFNSFQAVVEV